MDANKDILANLRKALLDEASEDPSPLTHLLRAQGAIHRIRCGGAGDWKTDCLLKISERMRVGLQRYGHGIILDKDTRQWGTREDSWMEMCEEEILDGIVYSIADRLRNIKLPE